MKKSYINGIVHSNVQIANDVYELKIKSGDSFLDHFMGDPGQFYMLRSWELDPLLSRPLSISNILQGMIIFIYEVVGKGTEMLSKLGEGDYLELLGPLGNGFNLDLKGDIGIVTGSAGIAPMIYLMEKLNMNIDFYCGFKDKVYGIDKIEKKARDIYISTEDGSVGHKGLITELFVPEKYDMVLTCGPIPMMGKVASMCKEEGVPVYLSMESRMACGFGACLGCTIETISGMKRVCKDGPIFSGEEVVFHD